MIDCSEKPQSPFALFRLMWRSDRAQVPCIRHSNTEPIIRIYAESNFETTANNIARRLMQDIKECSS